MDKQVKVGEASINEERKATLAQNNQEKNTLPGKSQNDLSFISQSQSSPRGVAKKFKNFPSNKEREFLNYYNTTEALIKSKEFKYIQFIGKRLLTPQEINQIINDRIKELESNMNIKRKIDTNRHSIERDIDKCIVDRNNNYLMKPTFNFNQNDNFFKTRHYFSVFLKGMTKVLIRNRAEKRMKKLTEMLSSNNIRNANDFGNYVDKNWIEYYSKDSQQEKDEGFSFLKMKFLPPPVIAREEVYLTNDYSIESLKQGIAHENNINLDQYREYEKLERSDMEVIGYKEIKSPGLTMYDPSTQEKTLRSCAENEALVRGERGDSEMSYEKILSLVELPNGFMQHLDTKIDTLLFNNPTLKKYATLAPFSEGAIEYNLQPRVLNTREDLYSNFQNELYMKLPLSIYEAVPLKDIDHESILIDQSLNFVPKKLKACDQKDLNIKEKDKVDEDNYIFELIKEDDEKLLEALEKDDDVIKNVREVNKNETVDNRAKEKIRLETLLQTQKRKWMATVPTVLEFYNSGITNPSNKLIL